VIEARAEDIGAPLALWGQDFMAIGAPLAARSNVQQAAFNPSGSRLVTFSGDTQAKVWETYSGTESLTLSGHASQVRFAERLGHLIVPASEACGVAIAFSAGEPQRLTAAPDTPA
jgi:WD40 repeat protein